LHVHLFLFVVVFGVANVGLQLSFHGKTHEAFAAIFSYPDDFGVVAIELEPAAACADDDLVFAKLDGGLFVTVEAVSCGVAAQERGERDPELGPEWMAFVTG